MGKTLADRLAVVNDVPLGLKGVVAVCEWATFDVLGNARDGYQVNDLYRQGEIRIPVQPTVSNVPRFPGASDSYRSFPAAGSFSCNVVVSFGLTDRAIRKALDIRCRVTIDGDDTHYTIDRESDGKPLAELTVLRYEVDPDSD